MHTMERVAATWGRTRLLWFPAEAWRKSRGLRSWEPSSLSLSRRREATLQKGSSEWTSRHTEAFPGCRWSKSATIALWCVAYSLCSWLEPVSYSTKLQTGKGKVPLIQVRVHMQFWLHWFRNLPCTGTHQERNRFLRYLLWTPEDRSVQLGRTNPES